MARRGAVALLPRARVRRAHRAESRILIRGVARVRDRRQQRPVLTAMGYGAVARLAAIRPNLVLLHVEGVQVWLLAREAGLARRVLVARTRVGPRVVARHAQVLLARCPRAAQDEGRARAMRARRITAGRTPV